MSIAEKKLDIEATATMLVTMAQDELEMNPETVNYSCIDLLKNAIEIYEQILKHGDYSVQREDPEYKMRGPQ